jgi:hypothetical protein
LTKLTGYAYDINVWKPVPGQARRIAMATPGSQKLSQFWKPGDGDIEQSFAIRKVFDPGQRMTVKDKAGWISVLAPVLDSAKTVVAMLEIACRYDRL